MGSCNDIGAIAGTGAASAVGPLDVPRSSTRKTRKGSRSSTPKMLILASCAMGRRTLGGTTLPLTWSRLRERRANLNSAPSQENSMWFLERQLRTASSGTIVSRKAVCWYCDRPKMNVPGPASRGGRTTR